MSDDNQMNVSIAVIQEQLKTLIKATEDGAVSRKMQYEKQEQQTQMLSMIDHRLQNVEQFVSGATPTLMEFNALKLKVQGAGILGRWLWFVAGVTISVAAWASGLLHNIFKP